MKSNFAKRVFCGSNALSDYLNPRNHPPTPLLQLPARFVGHYADWGIDFLAKLDYLTIALNVKARQAYGLVSDALERGDLEGITTLSEGTSGSTGHALPMFSQGRKVKAIVKPNLVKQKLAMMRLMGADTTPSDDGINEARRQGLQDGWFNLGQYTNQANPKAMEQLAQEVDDQTDQEVSVFCAGEGTRATVVGAARHFNAFGRSRKRKVKMVGVRLTKGHKVPGVRTEKDLQPNFGWQRTIKPITMERDPSFLTSIRLVRETPILGGPSSGFALAGLWKFLDQAHKLGKLDSLRNRHGRVVAVFVCPDPPHLYLDEYEPYLEKYEQSL